ncbi:MAG: hypothetical protein V4617_08145 [Gemmatimonadota bacterium]
MPGSYAALDLKEADVTFAATSAIKPGAVVGVKASGGVADGILAAISNQDVGGKFGVSVQVHLLRAPGTGVEFIEFSCGAMEAARRKARDAHGIRALEIERDFPAILRRREIAGFDTATAKIQKALDVARVAKDSSAVDSLTVEGLKINALRARAVSRLPADSQPDRAWLERASDSLRTTELQKARELLKVTGFTLGWWSLEYGVQSTTFRLFTPSAPRDSQLDKRVYPSHGGGVTYSRYTLSKASGSTKFWSIGTRVAWENNLGSLTKREVKDRTVYTAEPEERVAEATYTAYEGTYSENLTSLRVQGDYYRFLFRDNQVAWHLFPAFVAREESRTAYSAGLGLLLTARKESDAQTFVNAELFFRLNDLTDAVTNLPDSGAKPKQFFGRSDVGLRFSFPINFAPRP